MFVRESLPDDLPRIEKSQIAEPYKFWALYATSFYERFFSLINSKKLLKKAYLDRARTLKNPEAIEALNFFYRIRRDELDGLPIWESKLFENPDMIEAKNLNKRLPGTHTLGLTDLQVPFGYYKGKMRIGKINSVHPAIKMFYPDMEEDNFNGRNDMKYPGRIWISDKVISFWEYPNSKIDLYKILKDIEKEFLKKFRKPFTINPNNWYIEIVDKKLEGENFPENFMEWGDAEDAILIPMNDYKGSDEWSKEAIDKEHVKSPLVKKRKKVPWGVGSNSKKHKPLNWRQALYQENLVPSFKEFLEL